MRFALLRVDLRDGFPLLEYSSATAALRPAASDRFPGPLEPAPFPSADSLTPGRLVSGEGGRRRFGVGAFGLGRM